MERTTVLIVGHGSREASANLEFEGLVSDYRAWRPDVDLDHGYIELAQPSFDASLARLGETGAPRVVVVPLFLFTAGHVKNDIPMALDRARHKYPHTSFHAARALGVDLRLIELLERRVQGVAALALEEAKKTAVVVVGRGSSDPDANGDFYKLVRLFGEGRGYAHVLPTFIGITRPLVEETLELVARTRPERLIVAPYMLFDGRLTAKLEGQVQKFRDCYPWIQVAVTQPPGPDPLLFRILDERVRETLEGETSLPCDTCQYRAPMPGREENVGGLRAMLWSLRHSFTHTQAVPHVHAHKPIRKHVLVCGNIDCADRGSIALIETLRRLLKDVGRGQEQGQGIKVTKTSCMGRCGEGPTVVVYPDGIWYRGVAQADAGELVREHLLGDRLVARLVDNIMQ